jgi:hypothetical protein
MTKTETIKHIKEEILPQEKEYRRHEDGEYHFGDNMKTDGRNEMLHEVHSTLPSVYDYIEERVREEYENCPQCEGLKKELVDKLLEIKNSEHYYNDVQGLLQPKNK